MKRGSRIVVTLVTVLLLVFTAACVPAVTEEEEVVTPPVTPAPTVERGIIEIRVTDPPPADVEHVFVTLANIEVHRVSDNVTGWETIPIPTGNMTFDLMDVIGVEKVLGSANVTAGKYTQIRMDVAEVDVVFVTDNTTDPVATDNVTARVPSEKLRIVKPFEVEAGVKTILTLDFDGEKSLILPGKDIATGKERAIFKPVVRLLVEHSSLSATGVEVEVEEEEIEEEEEVGEEGEEEDVGEEEEEEEVGEEGEEEDVGDEEEEEDVGEEEEEEDVGEEEEEEDVGEEEEEEDVGEEEEEEDVGEEEEE